MPKLCKKNECMKTGKFFTIYIYSSNKKKVMKIPIFNCKNRPNVHS